MSLRIGLKAILSFRNKILLLKRASNISHGGKWDLPGGMLEPDEKLFIGLQREVFEESGIKIKKVNIPLEVGYFNSGLYRFKNVIRIIYLCRVDKNKVKLSPEHSEYMWLHISRLKEIQQKDFLSPKSWRKLTRRLKEVYSCKMESFEERI